MKKFCFLINILLALTACEWLEPVKGIASGTEVTITVEKEEGDDGTKSSFPPITFNKILNVNIFVFNAESGFRALDINGAPVGSYFDSPNIKLHFMPGKKYNIYILANTGRIAHPRAEYMMEILKFKIDDYNRFKNNGLPYASAYMDFSVENNGKVSLSVKKLVGAVDVSISKEAKWAEYEIKDICIKQAALTIIPFGHILNDTSISPDIYASRVTSAENGVSKIYEKNLDLQAIEDLNNGKSVRLYFLENMMGIPEKLRDNRDPHAKVSKNLNRDFAKMATYLEVSVCAKTVTASYEQARYRIYLGRNSYNDFSIQRASVCKCEIILKADTLEEEEWMLEPSKPVQDIQCRFYRGSARRLTETEEFAVSDGLPGRITIVSNIPVSSTSELKRLNKLYDSMTMSSQAGVTISKEEGTTLGDFTWRYNGNTVNWKHHLFYKNMLLDEQLVNWRKTHDEDDLKTYLDSRGIDPSETYYAFSYKLTTDIPMDHKAKIMDFDEGAQQLSSISISSVDGFINKKFNVGIFTKIIPFYLEYVGIGDYLKTVTPSCVLPDIYGRAEWGGYMYYMEEQYEWAPEGSFYYTAEEFAKEKFDYSFPNSFYNLDGLRCTADRPKSGTQEGFKNKIRALAAKAQGSMKESWIPVHCYKLYFNLELCNNGRELTEKEINEHIRYAPDAVFGENAKNAVYVQALEEAIGTYPWRSRRRNRNSFQDSNYSTRFVIVRQCQGSHLKLPGAIAPMNTWSCYPSGTAARYAYSYYAPSGERKEEYYAYSQRGEDKIFCPYSEYKSKYRFYGHVEILKDGYPGEGYNNFRGTLFCPVRFEVNINNKLYASDSSKSEFSDYDRKIIRKLSGYDSYMRTN